MSFIEDLIGSFAQAGKDVTSDITKDNQREREMQLQNDLALQRAEATEKLRIRLEEERAAAKQKRISDQSAEIEAAAPEVTAARQLGEAQGAAPSVDRNVLDIIKSKLTPAQLKQFYGVDTGAVAGIDDRLGIARQKGFYDAEAGLKAARSETVAAIKAEFDQQRQLNREDQADRKADQRDRQLDIMASKVANSGGGGANKVQSSYTNDQGYRVHTMTDGSSVIARDSDGNPITTESFAKRVEDKVKWLKKDGGATYRKLSAEELAVEARKLLLQQDGVKPSAPTAAPSGGYPDGTKLKGPGGKTYVVKNGVPVPQ